MVLRVNVVDANYEPDDDQPITTTDLNNQGATSLVAVTPDDTEELADIARALYVGEAGNIAVIAENDTDAVTFSDFGPGYLMVRTKQVLATGTTAGNIVALM